LSGESKRRKPTLDANKPAADPAMVQKLFEEQPFVTRLTTPEQLAEAHFSNHVWVIEYYVQWCMCCPYSHSDLLCL
jgi:hypothetical protein